jgi:hypothetical protein
MLSLPALSLSSVNGHTPRLGRRWSLVLTVLLITLLAHLLVLHWLNNQLQAISLFNDADDDDNAISVSLLRPEPQRTSRPPPQSATPPVPTPPATQPVESQAAEAKAAPESVPATAKQRSIRPRLNQARHRLLIHLASNLRRMSRLPTLRTR